MYRILSVFILLFFSCLGGDQEKQTQIKRLTHIVKESIGKKLIVPEGLRIYNPHLLDVDSTLISQSKVKIYSSLDITCSTCIDIMKQWDAESQKFNEFNVPLIFIARSDDDFFLFKYSYEDTRTIPKFNFPLFLDYKDDFFRQNEFMAHNKSFETVLTNQDNEIILIGNPLSSDEMMSLYLDKINEVFVSANN